MHSSLSFTNEPFHKLISSKVAAHRATNRCCNQTVAALLVAGAIINALYFGTPTTVMGTNPPESVYYLLDEAATQRRR
jgi:hypothetical protein